MAQHSDEAAAGYKAFDVKMIDDFMKTLKKEEPVQAGSKQNEGQEGNKSLSTVDKIMIQVRNESVRSASKITIVGCGQVGMAAAYSMMIQGICSELALVDMVKDKLQGEAMDLLHGQAFMKRCTVKFDTEYQVSADSKICVITAGARQKEGESRLNLVQRNVDILKNVVPQLVHYSSDTVLVVVSNPVDILAYFAWKLSGLPKHKVIGSGTMLDSSRFRHLISERFGTSANSCHAYIIGEHGDSSVAVWSSVNVGSTRLRDVSPKIGQHDDEEKWFELHQTVINGAYDVIKLKGYTSWAIGQTIATICHAICRNERNVYPLSTMAKGFHGIPEEVYLSLPCVLGAEGITHVVNQTLTSTERSKVQDSAKMLRTIIAGVHL